MISPQAHVRVLDEGLERSKLTFGGRRLSPYLRPYFVTEHDWSRISSIGETIFRALQKVKDAAVNDNALLDELGITEIERELVKIDPGYSQVSPSARLDSFLAGDSYSYVELNGESPAGIAYADSATEIFLSLPVMKRFSERYTVRGFNGRPLLLDALLSSYTEFCGGETPDRDPSIAIVDLRVFRRRTSLNCFASISNFEVTTRSLRHRRSWSTTGRRFRSRASTSISSTSVYWLTNTSRQWPSIRRCLMRIATAPSVL